MTNPSRTQPGGVAASVTGLDPARETLRSEGLATPRAGSGLQPQHFNAELGAKLVLLSLPKLGPARARWLMANGSALEAVEALLQRRLPEVNNPAPPGLSEKLLQSWYSQVQRLEARDLFEAELATSDLILDDQSPHWPFADDPEPPLVIFCRGDVGLLTEKPAVAIVGTRRCTSVGKRVARNLGTDLAGAGVVVVSGLAAGIDAATHQGALSAGGGAIGVVATGLDIAYPKSSTQLWDDVCSKGLLVSEARRGTRPERWRFPARNRLIAGLVDCVVVVESHSSGGALITVDEAADRGCPVFAVPGSVMSQASDGCNALLADGCEVVRSAADVLSYLGLNTTPKTTLHPSATRPVDLERSKRATQRTSDLSVEAQILAEASTGPTHIDHLVAQLGTHPAKLLVVLQRLEAAGYLRVDGASVCLQ